VIHRSRSTSNSRPAWRSVFAEPKKSKLIRFLASTSYPLTSDPITLGFVNAMHHAMGVVGATLGIGSRTQGLPRVLIPNHRGGISPISLIPEAVELE